jgi:hypothetical protein
MLAEAEDPRAIAGFADGLAELGRQHEAALFAARRKALSAVADWLSALHALNPARWENPRSDKFFPARPARAPAAGSPPAGDGAWKIPSDEPNV